MSRDITADVGGGLEPPRRRQPLTHLVEHHDVVMVLGPVVTHEDQQPSFDRLGQLNQRGDTNGLMESAQRHDTPPVVHLLTDRQGHGLRFELNLLQAPQCSPAGGSVHSFTDPGDAAVPLGPAPSSHHLYTREEAVAGSGATSLAAATQQHRRGRGPSATPPRRPALSRWPTHRTSVEVLRGSYRPKVRSLRRTDVRRRCD
jgi:hypothetical protein